MMKKILTVLLMLVGIAGANAQFMQQEQDTLRITLTNNKVYNHIWGDFGRINFSPDFTKMAIQYYDNDVTYDLDKVKSIRFYNRYSNPEVVLKAQGSGTYDELFQLSANPDLMFYTISCLASDEMFGGGGIMDRQMHEYDLLIDGMNRSGLVTAWDLYYKAVYNANSAIVHLQDLPAEVSRAEQRHALGEALFLRAFYYYELASLFGTVPVVTDNKSWAQKMRTSTPALVWGQILCDLKAAIAEMSENTASVWDDSRVGKYAAEALLARAYLFYTGFYLGVHDMAQTAEASVDLPDGTTLTKQDVIAYVEDCVNNSGFTLVPDYRNLWPYTNRITREDYYYTKGKNLAWVEDDGAVNPEVLFKIKYNKNASWSTSVGYANRLALYLGIRGQNGNSAAPFGEGWGFGTVAPNLYDDWNTAEPQDMRRDASIQDVTQLPDYRFGSYKDNAQETQYHEKKLSPIYYRDDYYGWCPFEIAMYGQEDGWRTDNPMQLANIHPLNLIRLADVLLMHSELTGTTDGINKVRARAGLSPLVAYSLQALQQERRWELAFEGVRWNDMRRFGDDYCKAALDAQMNQPIYNGGTAAKNPNGLDAYDEDPRPYSARYAENRGFFRIPELFENAGAMLIQQMQGNWTYDEGENTLLLDYVNISGTLATRYDPAGKEAATGTLAVTLTDNFEQRICQITFPNSSMLPMSKKYSDKEGNMTYDVISLDDSKMVLKANGQELTLRRPDNQATLVTQIHGIKWSYGTYTTRHWNTGEDITYGTIGNYSWEEPYISMQLGSIEGLYFPYIQGTTAADLAAFAEDKNMTIAEGEADPFAYMVFDLYENTIKKYTADGQLINTGTFTLERGSGDITIHTSENAILVPYRYNGQVAAVKDFSLRYQPHMSALAEYTSPMLALMTVSPVDNLHTYWMFGQRGFTNEEFDKALTIRQQELDGTPSETGRFLSINIDRERFCIYVEDCETGEQIKKLSDNTPFMIKVGYGQSVTKNLRFRMKNCNGTEAVAERTLTLYNPNPPVKYYIYGGPDRPDQAPFQPGAWDAAAMRFSDYEGTHLPTIPDEVYFGLKTLIFDVSDVSDDFDLKVMNGWWSNTYYDHVKWTNGLNELEITETIAKECARGADGRDLDLMLYSGTMTLNSVYYEE